MRPETKSAYPENWKAISNRIKHDRYYTCQGCGQIGSKPHNSLTVHHVDYNPANNDPLNLLVLCAKCHLRLQQGTLPYLIKVVWGQLFLPGFYNPPITKIDNLPRTAYLSYRDKALATSRRTGDHARQGTGQ